MSIDKKLHETLEISGNLLNRLEIQDEQLNLIQMNQNSIDVNQEESKKILRKMQSYLWYWYYGLLDVGHGMVNYVYSTKIRQKTDTKTIDLSLKGDPINSLTNHMNKSPESLMLTAA